MFFRCDYLYNVEDTSFISDLESQYGLDKNYIQRLLKILKVKQYQTRLILALKDSNVIGHYIYTKFDKWSYIQTDLSLIKKELIDKGIDLSLATIPVFGHLKKEYENKTNYLEYNNQRILDSISLGYKYGIVGVNSGTEFNCLQKPWLDIQDDFAEYSNTRFEPMYTLYKDKKVFIQHYGR